MKRKLIFLATICSLILLLLPACDARESGSLKSITHPYIANYECTEAKIGNTDLLKEFDYIEIVLVDKEKMQLVYKPKNGEKHIAESTYSYDEDKHELTAEIGIHGYKFRQSTIVENGKFTISKTIGTQEFVMQFKAK